jgi:hypothetical protein
MPTSQVICGKIFELSGTKTFELFFLIKARNKISRFIAVNVLFLTIKKDRSHLDRDSTFKKLVIQ